MRLASEDYITHYLHYSALGKLLTSVPRAPFAGYLPPDPAVRSIRQNGIILPLSLVDLAFYRGAMVTDVLMEDQSNRNPCGKVERISS